MLQYVPHINNMVDQGYWCSDFSIYQDHLEYLFRHRSLASTPEHLLQHVLCRAWAFPFLVIESERECVPPLIGHSPVLVRACCWGWSLGLGSEIRSWELMQVSHVGGKDSMPWTSIRASSMMCINRKLESGVEFLTRPQVMLILVGH